MRRQTYEVVPRARAQAHDRHAKSQKAKHPFRKRNSEATALLNGDCQEAIQKHNTLLQEGIASDNTRNDVNRFL